MARKKADDQQFTLWRTACESLWGLLAGIVGSLCCIGPSAAILFGLGSSSALFGWQVDQRYALLAGLIVLMVGGVLAVRRTRACAVRQRSPWHQIALMLVIGLLTYGLLGVLAPMLAVQQEDTATAQVAPAPVVQAARTAPTLRQVTLSVEKMYCPPCAAHLRGLFARKSFIQAYSVQAGDEQVTVVYDGGQVDLARVLALIPQNYGVSLRADQPLP